VALSCFAPHLAEEIYEHVFKTNNSISKEKWPTFDETKTVGNTVNIAVQIDGKLRSVINTEFNSTQEKITELALNDSKIAKFLDGQKYRIIFVKNKILNFIISK
jgi:leucyl-tRNA synthetase